MGLRDAVVVLSIGLTLAIAGCGDDADSKDGNPDGWTKAELDDDAQEHYLEQYPERGHIVVDCEDGLPAEEGAEVRCLVTWDGSDGVVDLRVVGSGAGARVDWKEPNWDFYQ